MSRLSSVSSVKAAQEGRLSELELPTEGEQLTQAPPPEEKPSAPPPQSALGKRLAARQPQQPQTPAEQEGVGIVDDSFAGVQAEVDRQRVPSLRERAQAPAQIRWLRPSSPAQNSAATANGGLNSRAKAMSSAAENGLLTLSAKGTAGRALEKQGVKGPELADAIAQTQEGSILSAMSRSGAVTYDPNTDLQVPDPVYSQIASAVVENEFGNILLQEAAPAEIDFRTQAETDADIEGGVGPQAPQTLTHATGNARIGQQIHQEYQRAKGVPVPDRLPQKEAETLAAAYKHMWAESNPNLVRYGVDPKTQQRTYQLTAEGETALREGEEYRKRLFPKTNVRPAKQPLVTGKLPGDVGATQVKDVAGKAVGKAKFGRVIESAMENLGQVANVVDKQRAKILFATVLPVLRDGNHESWQAEINNMGKSKLDKFQAAEELVKKDGNQVPYSAAENLAALVDNIAQEVRAVAQERNGANYLSYNVQGFNGRITPQQSFFNPTTSKAVRFATRSATPSIARPGSRVESNLRQMYAMMILPKILKADADLPVVRERKLTANTAKLEGWGDRLTEALAMSDAEYEAVAQAIDQGMALTDPAFPKFGGLDLDPEADAELIEHIKSKGEDGPSVIDGLMDFAKYAKAKRAGRPHNTYFNAYMDGKTNGLASNGIQMGHIETAERTGVIRTSRETLLDSGDIRDELAKIATESIDQGWGGNMDGFESEFNEVARGVFNHRDLNKKTTMTFGYGKEIDSFTDDMKETVELLRQKNGPDSDYGLALSTVEKNMDSETIAETLMAKYEDSLRTVMSEDAIQARMMMRSSAALFAATNQLMSIKGPTGMDINLGRNESLGSEGAPTSSYRLGGERTYVQHYEAEATSAAPKTKTDPETGEIAYTPGEVAYGGSVVAPVQALDASTVAQSASGRSWDRLSKASGGNPYLHTIYDAFKVDANGYDVMLEEINKNWLNTSMKYNYLQETYDATKDAMTKWRNEINDRIKANPNEKLTKNEAAYMQWFLQLGPGFDGPVLTQMVYKMKKFKDYPTKKEPYKDAEQMEASMKHVGYDVHDPPEVPTVSHLKQFVNVLTQQLKLSDRMNKSINKINSNKQKLKQEILKKGYKTPSGERIALQYYAH